MRRYLLPCILLLTDIVIMFGSSWLAVLIRFAMNEPQYPYYMAAIMANLPLFIIIHLLFFYQFKLYHRAWRYAGTRELIAIALANLCGIVVSYLVINNVFQLPYLPTGACPGAFLFPVSCLMCYSSGPAVCLCAGLPPIPKKRLYERAKPCGS